LGFKHTEETKRKMGEARKGNQNALGHKHTETARRKMSEALKGKRKSDEFRKKCSQAKRRLSDSDIAEIRRLLAQNTIKQYEIADKFNVSPATISRIKKGYLYLDVKGGRQCHLG